MEVQLMLLMIFMAFLAGVWAGGAAAIIGIARIAAFFLANGDDDPPAGG